MADALIKRLNRECGTDVESWKTDHALQIFCQYAEALSKNNFDHFDRAHKMRSLGKEDLTTLAEAKANSRGQLWLWLTVNPEEKKPTYNFFKFKDSVQSFLERSCFTKAALVFEQRGDTPSSCGSGVHIHCLLKRNLNYSPQKFLQCLKSSFNKWCNTNKNYAFYPKWINSKYIQDKIDYITSVKTGENKEVKQQFDCQFRNYNCLEPIYTKNWDDLL